SAESQTSFCFWNANRLTGLFSVRCYCDLFNPWLFDHAVFRGIPPACKIAQDTLIGLAWGPALRALIIPNLLLQLLGPGKIPNRTKVVAVISKAGYFRIVHPTRVHITPRVHKTRRVKGVATHGSEARAQILLSMSKVPTFEESHGSSRRLTERSVMPNLFDNSILVFAEYVCAKIAIVMVGLVRDVHMEVVWG